MFKPESNSKKNELDSLVLLRGIAVLMVCFCHFGNALVGEHIFSDLFVFFHEYGKYGVHVFFVISGFVIPLSLFKGKYTINSYGQFLYKRLLRLHPPYLAALGLTLLTMFFSYRVRHVPFPEDFVSILKSLAYLHTPADNPVFWTLLVEAQYYLFIGLFYTLILHHSKIAFIVGIPVLLILAELKINEFIPLLPYIVFFLIGTVGFVIHTKNGNPKLNIVILILLLIFAVARYELSAFLSSFTTIVIILTSQISFPALLKFPGKISYSIYLIHFPIGIKLINFSKSKINPGYSWLLLIITLVIVLLISWIFYRVFEEYSERLSKKIKYKTS